MTSSRDYNGERAATPGKIFPSRSSKLAPPPVLTWLTLSSVFHLAAQVAVSPPPIMVIVPRDVVSTTLSIKLFVPLLKFSNFEDTCWAIPYDCFCSFNRFTK